MTDQGILEMLRLVQESLAFHNKSIASLGDRVKVLEHKNARLEREVARLEVAKRDREWAE